MAVLGGGSPELHQGSQGAAHLGPESETRTPPWTGGRMQGHPLRLRLGARGDPGPVVSRQARHTLCRRQRLQAVGAPSCRKGHVVGMGFPQGLSSGPMSRCGFYHEVICSCSWETHTPREQRGHPLLSQLRAQTLRATLVEAHSP